MPFNNNLENLRVRHGMTQQQLAEKLGVTQGVISNYESGLKVPTLLTGIKIARIFGITTEELIEGDVKA